MDYILKQVIKGLTYESRVARAASQHHLRNARKLKRIQSFKHLKGEKRPKPNTDTLPAKADEYADEAYIKFWGLEHHRKNTLRKEAREMLLVYGFLRDVPYEKIESAGVHLGNIPDFSALMDTAWRFSSDSDNEFKSKFVKWQEDAEEFLVKDQLVREERLNAKDKDTLSTEAA